MATAVVKIFSLHEMQEDIYLTGILFPLEEQQYIIITSVQQCGKNYHHEGESFYCYLYCSHAFHLTYNQVVFRIY